MPRGCATPRPGAALAGSTASSARSQRVLVEGHSTGHTDGFAPVAIAGVDRGCIVQARITGRDGDHLVGVAE